MFQKFVPKLSNAKKVKNVKKHPLPPTTLDIVPRRGGGEKLISMTNPNTTPLLPRIFFLDPPLPRLHEALHYDCGWLYAYSLI